MAAFIIETLIAFLGSFLQLISVGIAGNSSVIAALRASKSLWTMLVLGNPRDKSHMALNLGSADIRIRLKYEMPRKHFSQNSHRTTRRVDR